ncbi:hypothetical protein [Chitinophaga sp. S165]|uniref:hypothetical protein n=1 Tax=Chitinophaga sp. S165 TaxID=2135462 RepID=UPI000D91B4E6|nr:hypothetical protein [Chitinophaga sp. S165]PWV56002.1 hypothetical protein C7475_101514 [Chitinophaga sp. S165]
MSVPVSLYGEHFTKNAPEIDTETNAACLWDTMDSGANGKALNIRKFMVSVLRQTRTLEKQYKRTRRIQEELRIKNRKSRKKEAEEKK